MKVALVGNANVGKSVIFNQMTGMEQSTGNWPGITVDVASGRVMSFGHLVEVIDLPGTYSLSSYSPEEVVTRDFLLENRVDVVIDVVDATALERNLYLTMQLLELGLPMVIALNQSDIARKKGIVIDARALSGRLDVPVVETVAPTGVGLKALMSDVVAFGNEGLRPGRSGGRAGHMKRKRHRFPVYGPEVQRELKALERAVRVSMPADPSRFIACKLVEGDERTARQVAAVDPALLTMATGVQERLSELHGEEPETVMSSERYAMSSRISSDVTCFKRTKRFSRSDLLDKATTHPVLGYIILAGVMVTTFFLIFTVGDLISGLLDQVFTFFGRQTMGFMGDGVLYKILWEGVIQGFLIVLAFVFPYILPFYILLALMEDSGYLARIAILMDPLMHRFGLHGKAFLPLVLGYGCSVPAVLGTRILETRRERLIAGFLATLVPCAARTIVIMAIVGAFMGWYWALGLYVFDLLVVAVVGRIANMLLPGRAYGLIMEVPRYRSPHLQVIMTQSWMRLKDFLTVALPIIVLGTMAMALLDLFSVTPVLNWFLSPITVFALGLPAAVGVVLILGVFQKELTVAMLIAIWAPTPLNEALTMAQMMTFTLFVMFYIPCISTLAAYLKEFGMKVTMAVAGLQFLLAFLIAVSVHLLLSLL